MSVPNTKEEFVFKPEISINCPFCDGRVAADLTQVLHTMPICSEYEAMEPVEFITAVRKRMEEIEARVRVGGFS